jgi:serine/threonine protein phosphatase 1
VHAGVDPARPLHQQTADDLLWIREPFLSCRLDLGYVVVHGHTVESEPIVRANRIGIDTGACWTGCLTCLVLEESDFRFLTTGARAQARAFGSEQ